MPNVKIKIIIGMAIVLIISIWMSIAAGPIRGMFYFFILTVLLWTIAKTRHWI